MYLMFKGKTNDTEIYLSKLLKCNYGFWVPPSPPSKNTYSWANFQLNLFSSAYVCVTLLEISAGSYFVLFYSKTNLIWFSLFHSSIC